MPSYRLDGFSASSLNRLALARSGLGADRLSAGGVIGGRLLWPFVWQSSEALRNFCRSYALYPMRRGLSPSLPGTFGGNRYNPVLPDWVILILNLMFSWAAGIAAMGLVWWHRRTRMWVVPVFAALLAVIGNWNGLCLPEVREVRLAYPNLPQELEGYRIFLYVSPGCGQCAWLPVRFFDKSEITVVVLQQCANR